MDNCIYCDTPLSVRTIEHVIPQFLGGNNCPSEYKIEEVCNCNSILGATVDAAFARCWPIAIALSHLKEPNWEKSRDFPLYPLGLAHDIDKGKLPQEYVAELWLGPDGEQVFWIRPSTKESEFFVGGDPILSKTMPSEIYVLLNHKSFNQPKKTIYFLKKLKKKVEKRLGTGKNLTKIICNNHDASDSVLAALRFDIPNPEQHEFSKYLMDHCSQNKQREISFGIDFNLCHRFFCKFAIGLNYVLFGEESNRTLYVTKLKKFLNDSSLSLSESPIKLADSWTLGNQLEFPVLRYAVTLVVLIDNERVFAALCIDSDNIFVFELNQIHAIAPDKLNHLKDGIFLALFLPLNEFCQMSFSDYIDHRCKIKTNERLSKLEVLAANLGQA